MKIEIQLKKIDERGMVQLKAEAPERHQIKTCTVQMFLPARTDSQGMLIEANVSIEELREAVKSIECLAGCARAGDF